jgi:putative transposase
VKSYHVNYSVTTLCRVLDVSPSGYYSWLNRMPSKRRQRDILLGDRIEVLHRKSLSNTVGHGCKGTSGMRGYA